MPGLCRLTKVGRTLSKVKESEAKTPVTQVDKCSQLLENALSHFSEAGQTAGQVDRQHGNWARTHLSSSKRPTFSFRVDLS